MSQHDKMRTMIPSNRQLPSGTPPEVRQLDVNDIPSLLNIQSSVYPAGYHEPGSVFQNRLALAKRYCHGIHGQLGHLGGYLIAHPWHPGHPSALMAHLDALPDTPTHLHIHDLAVHPEQQGKQCAQRLLRHTLRLAIQAGLTTAGLVAVPGAANYWLAMGFKPARTIAPPLFPDNYGAEAVFLNASLALLQDHFLP